MQRSKSVCWACRKVTKGGSVCPDCHEPMVNMGTRWRPPKRRDARRWAEQQRLHAAGRLPNGKAPTWSGEFIICRWCNVRHDKAHQELMDAAQGPAYPGRYKDRTPLFLPKQK